MIKVTTHYKILSISVIIISCCFAIFTLTYEFSEPKFPNWISYFSVGLSVLSILEYFRNYKNIIIENEMITLKSYLRKNKIINYSEIEEIEEYDFNYGGRGISIYNGSYLIIKSKTKSVKINTLNQPNYDKLRLKLKTHLGKKVTLNNHYNGSSMNYFGLIIFYIPGIFLIYKIIEKLFIN